MGMARQDARILRPLASRLASLLVGYRRGLIGQKVCMEFLYYRR